MAIQQIVEEIAKNMRVEKYAEMDSRNERKDFENLCAAIENDLSQKSEIKVATFKELFKVMREADNLHQPLLAYLAGVATRVSSTNYRKGFDAYYMYVDNLLITTGLLNKRQMLFSEICDSLTSETRDLMTELSMKFAKFTYVEKTCIEDFFEQGYNSDLNFDDVTNNSDENVAETFLTISTEAVMKDDLYILLNCDEQKNPDISYEERRNRIRDLVKQKANVVDSESA